MPDMMILCNCGITPNQILNFHRRVTHLLMDVTISRHYMTSNQTFQEKKGENVENKKDFTRDNIYSILSDLVTSLGRTSNVTI